MARFEAMLGGRSLNRFGTGLMLALLHAARVCAQPEAPAYTPPPPDLKPWYFEQRFSLLGVVGFLVALFALELFVRGRAMSERAVFQRARLFALLCVFGAVAIWGFGMQARREARRSWQRALHVAVVVLADEAPDPLAIAAFQRGARDAAQFLQREHARFAADRGALVHFHVFGPISLEGAPPSAPVDASLWQDLMLRVDLLRYFGRIDARLALPAERYDGRMYLLTRRPRAARGPRFVEGVGEAGGELGVIRIDLDQSMVQAAWTAVLHEVLHTVGASDKYDAAGHARIPDGIVEPARVPLYPQRFAEIMVGEVPLGPGRGRLPLSLAEVAVGATTAREIGWR